MAVFLKAREGFLGGDIDWNTHKFKAILCDWNDAGPTAGSWTMSGLTYSGTTVTATLPTGHGFAAGGGESIEVFGVSGVTNVNGVWTTTSSTATTVVFTVTSTPTGTYSATPTPGWVCNLTAYTNLSQILASAGRVAYGPTAVGAGAGMTGMTITNGTADAADVTFTSVPGPDPVEAVLVVQTATTTGGTDAADTAQRLVWINTPSTPGTSGLPVTPNGGDISITWNASGLFAI